MAEHTREEWHVVESESNGWCVFGAGVVRYEVAWDLTERDARQIVREHNAHPGLVDACKAALAEFKPILDDAMCDEVGERPKVKIERMLDAAIADVERKGGV